MLKKFFILFFFVILLSIPVQAEIEEHNGLNIHFLQTKDGRVLVVDVADTSKNRNKILAGDEIIKIDNKKVKDLDFPKIRRYFNSDKDITLNLLRNKKPIIVTVSPEIYYDNGYFELEKNHIYLNRESIRRDGDYIYFWTKYVLPKEEKKEFKENIWYFMEYHKINCKDAYYSREDLQIFDINNKQVDIPEEVIFEGQYLNPENPLYSLKSLFCSPDFKENEQFID